MHAQLATLVVASFSSILPWQHPTCITSNMPRHTKHNHAPGDHPHAATSVFNEATRESSVAPRTHTARASCTFASAALFVLGSPHGALTYRPVVLAGRLHQRRGRWCRCARPQRPRLPSIVATLGSGSRRSSCRMPVATRRACGGAGCADRAIETSPGASGSVLSPDPPSRRARVEPERPTSISPSSHRRDATGDDHDAQDATDAGGSGPRPHYTAPRPASTEPPGFKPAFKCPGWRLFGFALPPCLLLPRFLDLCIAQA